MTWIVTVAVPLPPALVAVTVYSVEEDTAVGVPLIAPFDVLNVKPEGSAGEIDHETTAPPPVVGVMDVIATPFVRIEELVLYVTVGAATLTSIVTVAVALPPVLVAVTV